MCLFSYCFWYSIESESATFYNILTCFHNYSLTNTQLRHKQGIIDVNQKPVWLPDVSHQPDLAFGLVYFHHFLGSRVRSYLTRLVSPWISISELSWNVSQSIPIESFFFLVIDDAWCLVIGRNLFLDPVAQHNGIRLLLSFGPFLFTGSSRKKSTASSFSVCSAGRRMINS